MTKKKTRAIVANIIRNQFVTEGFKFSFAESHKIAKDVVKNMNDELDIFDEDILESIERFGFVVERKGVVAGSWEDENGNTEFVDFEMEVTIFKP